MENENNNLNLTSIRIKQMRLERNWTQKDLSKKLGLKNDTAIANYEAGYSTPKDDIKLKMSEIFDCTLDYLMGKSDIRNYDKDEQEFKFAYHKEMEGLTDEEIADALRFYKEMKKKYSKWF